MNSLGLYVHIPFCASKCAYCAFTSAPCGNYLPYVDALAQEMKDKAKRYSSGKVLDSIYFGGGTPSLLSKEEFSIIFEAVRDNFTLCKNCEITVEANPASANFDKLSFLREAGVNRVSLGLQCANENILKTLRRPHGVWQFLSTAEDVKRAGIKNFSADIMIGLPNQSVKDVEQTLCLGVESGARHLSCYALKIERGTSFYRQKASLNLPSDDETADMYDFCLCYLKDKGFARYEISNFAKDGFACKHNLKYWKSRDYLAVGVSAGGFISPFRYQNIKNTDKYIDRVNRGERVSYGKKLSKEELIFEYLMMALRLDEGFDVKDFYARFCVSFEDAYAQKVKSLIEKGFLSKEEDRIYVPQSKSGVLNSILIELLF